MADVPAVDAMICIRDLNPRGLPSRHGELFHGKPLLEHVVERLRRTAGIRDIGLICPQSDPVIEAVAARYGCRIHDSTLSDIERRPKLRRQRLWSTRGWRGGLDYASVFDEDGWPEAMLAIHEAHPADRFYVVGAEWPCLDPGLSSRMIEYSLKVGGSALTIFHQGSPGLLGQVMSRPMLEQMAGAQSTLRDALAVSGRGKDDMDQQKGPGNFDLPLLLTQNEFRFAADSPRLHRWLEKLTPGDPDSATQWMKAALDQPFGEGPPEEVEWEWVGPEGQLLESSVFSAVCDEILVEPDALVTVDGRGDWIRHPDWNDMARKLKERRCHGLHLRLEATHLHETDIDELVGSRADVLSFIIDDHHDDDGVNAVIEELSARREPVFGPRIVVEMARTQKLLPHWEGFWNRWFGKVDRILWRHPSRGGLILLNRGVRHPCRRLARELQIRWDGTIPLCREDRQDRHAVGRFPEITLTMARKTLNERWLGHRSGDFGTPCGPCDGWDRLTP